LEGQVAKAQARLTEWMTIVGQDKAPIKLIEASMTAKGNLAEYLSQHPEWAPTPAGLPSSRRAIRNLDAKVTPIDLNPERDR